MEIKDRTEKIIKLVGHKQDVDTFCDFLRHIEYLGNIGASRNLLLRIDGDGSGRMHFYDDEGCSVSFKEKFNTEEYKNEAYVVEVYDIG